MKLPNSKSAIIPKEKLTNCLLSETHPTGRFKARFFRNLGFDENNVKVFETCIRKLAEKPISEISTSSYGTKYIIDGEIETPSGEIIKVRTVWVIEKGQNRPRFITIYPV